MKLTSNRPRDLVKRAMFLAWKACGGPLGYGFLQDRGPDMTEDQVWEQTVEKRDYPGGNSRGENRDDESGRVYGDYVFGRMMKIGFDWDKDTIEYRDQVTPDYQSWSRTYRTTTFLLEAAAKELEASK